MFVFSAAVPPFSAPLKRRSRSKGLVAPERLTGMILTTVSVQMFQHRIETKYN